MVAKRNKVVRPLLTLLVGLPFLFILYWGAISVTLKQGASYFLQSAQHGSVRSDFLASRLTGFPSAFSVTLLDPTISQGESLSWTTAQLEVSAPSHRLNDISLNVLGPQQINSLQLGQFQLESEQAHITILLKPALSLPLGEVELFLGRNTLLSHSTGWNLSADHLRARLQEDGRSVAGLYQLHAEARNVDLRALLPDLEPSYATINTLDAGLEIQLSSALDRATLADGAPALRAVRVQNFSLRTEDVLINANGHFIVPNTGRISGIVELNIQGWSVLLNTLAGAGYIDPDLEALISQFTQDSVEEDRFTLPLTINEGRVSFGVFSLGLLPDISVRPE